MTAMKLKSASVFCFRQGEGGMPYISNGEEQLFNDEGGLVDQIL